MAHKTSKRGILKKYVGTGGPGRNQGIPEFIDTTYLKGNGKSKGQGNSPLLPNKPLQLLAQEKQNHVPAGLTKFDTERPGKAPVDLPLPAPKREDGAFSKGEYGRAREMFDQKIRADEKIKSFTPGVQGMPEKPMPMTSGYAQSTPAVQSPALMFSQTRKTPDQAQAQASPMFQQKRKMLRNKLSQLTGIPQMK